MPNVGSFSGLRSEPGGSVDGKSGDFRRATPHSGKFAMFFASAEDYSIQRRRAGTGR